MPREPGGPPNSPNTPLTGAEIQVIEADTGKEIFKVKESRPVERSMFLTFSQDGNRLAWGISFPEDKAQANASSSAEVKILDAATGKELRRILLGKGGLTGLLFSPNNKHLVTAIAGAKSSAGDSVGPGDG